MREPIRITQDHLNMYAELLKRGVTLTCSIEVVSDVFDLPTPHTRHAVEERLTKIGVEPKAVKPDIEKIKKEIGGK